MLTLKQLNKQTKSIVKQIKPFIIEASDYHNFDDLRYQLTQAGFDKVDFIALEYAHGYYHALFYFDKLTRNIENLAKQWNLENAEEDDEE